MFPTDLLAIPVYIFMPLALAFMGLGDYRNSDDRFLAHVSKKLFTLGVGSLAFSWVVTVVLSGVAGFLWWRDMQGSVYYEIAFYLHWVQLACWFAWIRCLKMYTPASTVKDKNHDSRAAHPVCAFFIGLLGVFGCSLATLTLYGMAGTATGNWSPFGVYFLPVLGFFCCIVWTGRLAFSETPFTDAANMISIAVNGANNVVGETAKTADSLVAQGRRTLFSNAPVNYQAVGALNSSGRSGVAIASGI